jgi:hypothetical protein
MKTGGRKHEKGNMEDEIFIFHVPLQQVLKCGLHKSASPPNL